VQVIDERGDVVTPLGDRVKQWLKKRALELESSDELLLSTLLRGNWTYFPSLAWRRDAIEHVNLRGFEVVQDLALLVDVLLRGERLVVDEVVVFEYRRHLSSDSSRKAVSGERFKEEAEYHRRIAAELRLRGWTRAAIAARLRATSRAHALCLLPAAVRRGEMRGSLSLARHAFGA
jgi:hypothetical protein